MCNCGGGASKSRARYSGVQRSATPIVPISAPIQNNSNIQSNPAVSNNTAVRQVRYSVLNNYTNKKDVQNENNESQESQENLIEAPEVNNESNIESEVNDEVTETIQG